jgi:hypothetical protein
MPHRISVPHRRTSSLLYVFSLAGLIACLGTGCFRTRQVLDAKDGDGGMEIDLGDVKERDSGTDDPPKAPGDDLSPICGAHSTCEPLQRAIDKVDLLFVIDNSDSMAEEQGRLTAQFERMVAMLTTGDRGPGLAKFAAVTDLHIGVVSSDMGATGIDDLKNCDDRGDDGILQHEVASNAPASLMCAASYPPFLSHDVDSGTSNVLETANDLACIAPLGTDGCGFEQPLEAALKALWPAVDPMPVNGINRITFMPDRTGNADSTLGHGDDALNGGFLRNDPERGESMIAVVVLSDKDDGSSSNNMHLVPKKFLNTKSPLYSQPLNLRNFYNPDELYPVARYVLGLRELRPDDNRLVVFGAIAGVPPELASEAQTREVASNPMVRESFYDALLDNPNMQEIPDPATMTTPDDGNLKPSCLMTDADGAPNGKAYPPRRLVEVARGFEENGFVSSICDDDFAPAIDALVDRIAARPAQGCLARPLVRAIDGLVHDCSVLFVLPEPLSYPGVPSECEQDDGPWAGVLEPAGRAYERSGIPAKRLCKVRQLPVEGRAVEKVNTTSRSGWYYDDFSDDASLCARGSARIAIVNDMQLVDVPTGVRAILDCE